ncbi:ATP synthase subunit [Lottiidibacillus patelloidae]|uniref:ATP synthase subunit n=1 Tax=Lottiidibacillus patelloidae TaxID=2670334 RepID=A0A263BT92_9BACI|nr:ATP synthase subunit I [Lottiidibacillus patelloidae]OZM56792.1 ATP synthase subunit [Lottiidibacillus patelloidae]
MTEYEITFKRYLSLNLFALSIFIAGWAITPYDTVFLGLLLGGSGSLYNLWQMYRKTNKLGNAAANKQKQPTLGSLSRLMTGGLAALIALRYPETFHLVSVVVGLMASYIIIFIDFLSFQTLRRKRGE